MQVFLFTGRMQAVSFRLISFLLLVPQLPKCSGSLARLQNLKSSSMNFSKICNFECASLRSSESDSSSQRDEEFFYPRTNASKHKTELCKTFEELGCCPYERKCRFAHGKHELVKVSVKSGSKARKCNGFWKNGCCSYGLRCQFGHAEVKWEDSAVLLGLEAACCERMPRASKLMKLLN